MRSGNGGRGAINRGALVRLVLASCGQERTIEVLQRHEVSTSCRRGTTADRALRTGHLTEYPAIKVFR